MASQCSVFFGFVILFKCCFLCVGKRTWDCEVLSINSTCPQENLINATLRVERIARGKSAISGVIDWKFEADESLKAKMQILSSQSGRNDDYSPTPYKIPDVTFNDYMISYYDELVYANFGNCSNIPHVEGGFTPPFPRKVYILDRCTLNGNGFPDILPVGYYKLVFSLTGQAEFYFDLIVKLTTKLF